MPHSLKLILAFSLSLLPALSPANADERRYHFYQPEVKHVTIYEGSLKEGRYGYNHMASVEWFDGEFHCVWGANPSSHKEGEPGQVNLWATSGDFLKWSAPRRLAHEGAQALTADAGGEQWQPNLLNYHQRQLWCVWSFNSADESLDGLYLSTLEKGAVDWQHRRVQRRQRVGDASCAIFASQNPVLLPSGRVLAPVTLVERAGKGRRVRRWNACFHSDDDGATWQCSEPVSSVDDAESQWEPFFYQQADGGIRAYMRNSVKGSAERGEPPSIQQRLTTVGTGAARREPVRFPRDPVFSFMETANCRPQVFQLPGGRYCLLQQDAWVNHTDYHSRLNVALHFSRDGADDFVAGPPVSRPGVISAYPQGVEHEGVIYAAYTTGPGNFPRSIEGAVITPAPAHGRYYIWPRSKEIVRLEQTPNKSGNTKMLRANPDERTAPPRVRTLQADTEPGPAAGPRKVLEFSRRASAGVDIDPVDFAAGRVLEFECRVKVETLQSAGRIVFCSFGDRIPIRLGMLSNRPGKLYAYGRGQWEPAGELALQQWHTLRLAVRGADFTVAVDGHPPAIFACPIVNPTPRLYLGDGFELDYLPTLSGSSFLVDIASVWSRVH